MRRLANTRPFVIVFLGIVSLGLSACGADDEPGPTTLGTGGQGPTGCGADAASVAGTSGEFAPEPADGSACGAVVTEEASTGASHVAACSSLSYSSNPPSSGNHYGVWADVKHYEEPVARGNWVHSLEHGAIVVVYNCTNCDDEIAEAAAWVDTLPEDPSCAPYGRLRRVVLTPDPLLDVRWAAASWGYTLRSDCFEPDDFTEVAVAHSRKAPVDLCNPP
jgi:hypothetical protein